MRFVRIAAVLLACVPFAARADPRDLAEPEVAGIAGELERGVAAGRELTRFRMPFANKYVVRRCDSDAAPARERLDALGPRIAALRGEARGELERIREIVRGCLECRHESSAHCDRAQESLDALQAGIERARAAGR